MMNVRMKQLNTVMNILFQRHVSILSICARNSSIPKSYLIDIGINEKTQIKSYIITSQLHLFIMITCIYITLE